MLHQALQHLRDRSPTHGPIEDTFHLAAEFWSVYLSSVTGKITPRDVAQMLELYKMARAQFGDRTDPEHYADRGGYAAIAGALSGVK